MNIDQLTLDQWYLQPPATEVEIGRVEAALGFALPDDYRSLIMWSNGGDLIFGERYFRFWRLERVLRTNKFLEVSKYLPGTVAIGNDGGDMLYLLDYRADRDHPALIEVEGGCMSLNEFVRDADSLEAALRAWSGLDAARSELLSVLVARAAVSEEQDRIYPKEEG
jgi:hypothetical protein